MPTLGVIVVGQSPRPKVEAELRRVLGAEIGIRLRGALDGMSRAEIGKAGPADGGETLFTELPSGEGVSLSKAIVTARMQALIDDFAAERVDTTFICCTGKFKGLRSQGHVVWPSAVLSGLVTGLLPEGRLGVLVPLPEQIKELGGKWHRPGLTVKLEPLLPIADDEAVRQAASRLALHKPDLIVMDCMSYGAHAKALVREVAGPRVILAVSAAARSVGELLG